MISNQRNVGLYRKYSVQRLGDTAGRHENCNYFVLDVEHDPFARDALLAYIEACENTHPFLAEDLRKLLESK